MTSTNEIVNSVVTYLSKYLAQPTDNSSVFIAGIITIAAAVLTVNLTAKTQQKLARRAKTIEFLESFASNEKYHNYASTIKNYLDKQQLELLSVDIFNDINADKAPADVQKAFRHCLNLWERLAIACRLETYDTEVLYENYGSHVISMYKRLYPYIEGRRATKGNERVYLNFEWLAVKWVSRRQVHEKVHKPLLKQFVDNGKLFKDVWSLDNQNESDRFKIYKQVSKKLNTLINKIYESR